MTTKAVPTYPLCRYAHHPSFSHSTNFICPRLCASHSQVLRMQRGQNQTQGPARGAAPRPLRTPWCTKPSHATIATRKGQFWILLLRVWLLTNSSSRCPPPHGRFLCPCLLHFTPPISSCSSPGTGNSCTGRRQLPLLRKLKFRSSGPGSSIRSGQRASCPSELLLTDLHTRGQPHAPLPRQFREADCLLG